MLYMAINSSKNNYFQSQLFYSRAKLDVEFDVALKRNQDPLFDRDGNVQSYSGPHGGPR